MIIGYKDLCSLSSSIIAASTCFIMGVFYSNLAYDANILFNGGELVTEEQYELVLKHYQTLLVTKRPLLYILAFIAFIGLVGHLVRTYKPNPELQMFEYASLIAYILGVCVFITNIKTGIECTVTHQWGEVDEKQGLAVLGCSNIILLGVFGAVLFLQAGLWYSTLDYEKRMAEFIKNESKNAPTVNASSSKSKKNNRKNKKE